MPRTVMYSRNATAIAEALWGRGGTSTTRCNRKGAWHVSCSSHGGMIIDAASLTDEERSKIASFVEFHDVRAWFDRRGKQRAFWHPFRRYSGSMQSSWEERRSQVIILEEDADWSIATHLLGIMPADMTAEAAGEEREASHRAYAADSFWRYHDPANPEIQHRKKVEKLRESGCSDLIVSAISETRGTVKVTTANGAEHLVTGYEDACDKYGTPWLSKCASASGPRRA